MNRDELAEHVVMADDEARGLAPVLEILRREPDRCERRDVGEIADLGPAVDYARRSDPAAAADDHVTPDRDVRTDDRPCADPRLGMHDRGRMDVRGRIRPAFHRDDELGFGNHLAFHGRGRDARARCCRAAGPW